MHRFIISFIVMMSLASASNAGSFGIFQASNNNSQGNSQYSQWSNYPQSGSFFPLAVWLQNPTATSYGSFASNAAAAVGTKINIYISIDNGAGGSWSPTGFGTGDSGGQFAAIASKGMYVIPQINAGAGVTPNNTANNSIASISALASSLGYSTLLAGYNMGDEPQTVSCSNWPMSSLPSQIATFTGYDSTRPVFLNSTNYIFNSGSCAPQTLNTNYTAAISVASIDDYPLTNPYHTSCCSGSGTPVDQLWRQGWTTKQLVANRTTPAPVWMFVDSGTDELSFSSQNSFTCSSGTCTNGTDTIYQRAPANLVNAEVWMTILNGATGIEYFPQDSTGLGYALGQGGGAGPTAAQQNLTYINTTILSYAAVLNTANTAYCTMITGSSYSNFTTSCSNSSLSVSTTTIPATAMTKSYNGATYLFAQTAHNGSDTLSFTITGLAGKTATIVYDSNCQYDATHCASGNTFTLNGSGAFSDTFGANSDNYQNKIYSIQ